MPDRFTYVKRGYDPEEVDRYIETLEQVVKSYKDKDSAIKNAIVSAQMAADNIVKNAHNQVAESRTQALSQIQSIIASIGEQRSRLKDFQEEYTHILRKYLTDIDENDMGRINDKITALEQLIARAAYIAPAPAGGVSSYASPSPYAPTSGYTAPSSASPYASPYSAPMTSGSVAYDTSYDMEEE